MEVGDETDHVFNVGLTKLTGLYQVLDPETVTRFRGRNAYHVVTAFFLSYHFVVSSTLLVSGWYYWANNLASSIVYIINSTLGLYLCCEIFIMVYNSGNIWNLLSITRYNFTSYRLPNKREILDGWRSRSNQITTLVTTFYALSGIAYTCLVMRFSNVEKSLTNHDGTVGIYRVNTVNLHLLVSAETYNAHYYVFFFFEYFITPTEVMFYIMFDNVLVIMCLAICCQFQVVCASFESVGHVPVLDTSTPEIGDHLDKTENISNDHDLIYDGLITIIKDHQAVIQKLEEFLAVFKQIMMAKFVILSSLLIALSFTVIMSLSKQDKFEASTAETIEMIVPIPVVVVQLFMLCYLFEMINNQKDSIIFALYSSNWSEMNIKCRNLIILTLKMNNANQIKLKFTRTRIINLEMFFKTMGDCYTVISVLINCLKPENG